MNDRADRITTVVARAAGGPEVIEVVRTPRPAPAAGEVRVRVGAIGVNFADVMCRQAVHRSMRPPPIVLGCEAAGVIDAVGPGVAAGRVGERVGVYSPFGGAYAESLVVPSAYALPLPPDMPVDVAAAFTHVYLTAWTALHLGGDPVPGDSVLVTAAAGGLGGALLDVAVALGLRPVAAVGSPVKAARLRERGVGCVVDYADGGLARAVLLATDGRGVDVAVETVGGALCAEAQACLAPLGRLVIAGMAGGDAPVPDVPTLLARSAVCATLNLSVVFAHRPAAAHAAWNRIVGLWERGRLTPRIGHRFALADAAQAHRLLESRASTDKILLVP